MRTKSLRRRIYETACELVLGRMPKDEYLAVEDLFNARWYGSGQTDFMFYSDPDYKYLLLHSWVVASQYDIEKCVTLKLLRDPKTVLDFHGGIGMTACYLAASLPEALVMSHTAVQWHWETTVLLADALGLKNVAAIRRDSAKDLPKADLLIAQETLEHFKDPFSEMRTLLETVQPSQYLDGSSFTFDSPGHFNPFYDDGVVVPRESAKRRLNGILRDAGYVRPWEDPKTGVKKLFNGRPALWSRPL